MDSSVRCEPVATPPDVGEGERRHLPARLEPHELTGALAQRRSGLRRPCRKGEDGGEAADEGAAGEGT